MSEHKSKHLVSGALAGMAGGLTAAWLMNQFTTGPGKKLTELVQSDEEKQQPSSDGEDATMKTADALVNTATGGRHLSYEGKSKGGPVVHYSFGALMGGLYGGLSEYAPFVRTGFGTLFGAALFVGADLIGVPAFHLSPPATEQPPSSLATPFASHLVYGAATELVRRGVRSVL